MKTLYQSLFACFLLLLGGGGPEPVCAAGEVCDDYVREDKAYGARVKADLKRYARSQGVPERLMYLYDQLGDCPVCLGGNAEHPILPFIYIVYAPDAGVRANGLRNIRHRGTAWSADEEYGARQGMRDGYVKAFYILLEETPCECCRASTQEEWDAWNEGQPDPSDAPDWNDDLGIDTSRSDAHENADELGPDPDDLTNIDDKDRYPDQLPWPPLNIPPLVRPITTGCGACEPLVAEHNDLAILTNAQARDVAKAERNVKIASYAIRFALREIRAHERLAKNDTWKTRYQQLLNHYGDLVAIALRDVQALNAKRARRAELLRQLELLKQNIRACESRCTLLNAQPAPSIQPEPLADDAEAALPPYVRIASQVCPTCSELTERRNEIARDMNELVQGMIDAGLNGQSLAAWADLRARLDNANAMLQDCVARCSLPAASPVVPEDDVAPEGAAPGAAATVDVPQRHNVFQFADICPACRKHLDHYRFLLTQLDALNAEDGRFADASDKMVRTRASLHMKHEAAQREEIAQDLERLLRQWRKVGARLDALQERIYEAETILIHCQSTMCDKRPDFLPDVDDLAPDIIGFDTADFLIRQNRLFVATSCLACRDRAKEINDWILSQYSSWLTQEFVSSLSKFSDLDDSERLARRYRFLEFLADLEKLVADLKDCNRRACQRSNGAVALAAYRANDIAPRQCLENDDTRDAARAGDAKALPDTCHSSWLEHFLQGCGDKTCSGIGDTATDASPGTKQGVLRTSQSVSSGLPDDPFFTSAGNIAAGLADQWGTHQVLAYEAISEWQDVVVRAVPTIVAVIDSGLDTGHPDLAGRLWKNPAELPGNGIDDDRNGFVDDVHGWNFVGNNNDVSDHNGHGTLVAGVVGATPDNGIGIAGVNPWARIMPIKVTNFLGRGNSVDIAAAINYAVGKGARVLNISLGGTEFSEVERAAVEHAASQGALVVVAAGNQGNDAAAFWPAGLDNVITVAAMDDADKRARYSNWGSPVDIAAPGSNILSLRARYTDLLYFVEDDYVPGRNVIGDDRLLYHATGTSFAAPFVTGIVSLVWSLRPELAATQLRRMVLHSATDVETPGIDEFTGFGLVSAPAALKADPAYFIDAGITGITAVRREGRTIIQVSGLANADQFRAAELQLGAGESPTDWQPAGATISAPVIDRLLAEFDAQAVAGSPTWTLRLRVTHQNGSLREARFRMNLQ
ncbi:MAG TPA: S8 family peptidase [Woeseiaceae bacterium]|nr:S8 family peptidase [Woeseiaceae bacterium]